jgi:hypothetical protein
MTDGPIVRFVTRVLDRFEPATDRFNPILVKEVRQFLRGNGFVWSFVVMVVVAAAIGAMFIVQDEAFPSEELGERFLVLLFGVLLLGMLVLVPLQAFQSLGAEWEGETMDQLALSGLTPSRIAAGKLWSAALQSLLLVASFAPFIALGFLMRGVDILAVAFAIAQALVVSLWLTAAALAISSLSKQRVLRGIIFVALGFSLFSAYGAVMASTTWSLSDMSQLRDPDFVAAMATAFLAGSCAAAFCHYSTSGRLAHSEENSSTPLRLLAAGSSALFVVWMGVSSVLGWLRSDAFEFLSAVMTVVLALLGILWATERGRFGRRVANDLSFRGSRTRRLPSPFLPGGGRGFLFALLTIGGAALVHVAAHGAPRAGIADEERWFGFWVLCLYSFYVGLPSALLARLCVREFGVWLVRVLCVVGIAAGVVVPSIFGLVLDDTDLSGGRHAFNVFWVLEEAIDGDLDAEVALAVLAMGLAGLAFNVPRVVRSFAEVRDARAGRIGESDPAVLRSRAVYAPRP